MRGSHFFGNHPAPLRNTTAKRFTAHIAQFKGWYGPKVINCTPGSALKAFPIMDIRTALKINDHTPGPAKPAHKAFKLDTFATEAGLISAEHQELYHRYYAQRSIEPRPSAWLSRVELLAQQLGAGEVIDYGCGANQGLSPFAKVRVIDYDPGLPEFSGAPQPADLVVSIHVLEHVEPDCVDNVINHMTRLARKGVLIVVSCEPSTKMLPDGSPWHCFVRSADWWRGRLASFDPQPVLRDRVGAEFAALYRVETP
jgi:hypothetical protein